jgi:neutral ceramidase
MSDQMQFGAALREITPAYPAWLHGYADRDHPSTGVSEAIYLGCVAIGNGADTVLFVTCDMIGIEAHVCERLYALLERETGLSYPHIVLSCSHSHFAPALHTGGYRWPDAGIVEPDPRFVSDFETKLVEAARESLRNMQPGQLEVARMHAPQVAFNRRTVKGNGSVETNFMYPRDPLKYTLSPTDTQLTALRAVDESGVKLVLAHYGCHPVTGGESRERDHYKISADYVAYLRQTIARHYACPTFFALGAAGDAVPINRYGDCRQRIGSLLGHTVILAERTFVPDQCGDIWADDLGVEVRTIVETDPKAAEAEFREAREAYSSLLRAPNAQRHSPAYRAAAETYQRKMAALLRSRLYPQNTYTVRVQFLKIGSTTWVGLPFEVLAEISLRIKEQFPQAVLLSCTGGYQGYLPLAYEYDRGGYEASASSTHFEPGTADRLLEAILGKLAEWAARESDQGAPKA